MTDFRRPSFRFRLWQFFFLPLRILCHFKGHIHYKWACKRCLRVDEVQLAAQHIEHFRKRGKLMKRWDQ